MKLRLGGAGGTTEHFGDFTMLVTMEIVQEQGGAKAAGQTADRLLEQHAIGSGLQTRIGGAELDGSVITLILRVGHFVERGFLDAALAETHKDGVACDAVQPCGESRLAAKFANAAKNSHECVLHEILGLCRILDHAETKCVDALIVPAIEDVERRRIALAGKAQRFAFRKVFQFEWHSV